MEGEDRSEDHRRRLLRRGWRAAAWGFSQWRMLKTRLPRWRML